VNTAPSKTKYITESKVLPFEPTMRDILEVWEYFRDKYNCLPTEVLQEERGDWETCLVFYREIPNPDYDQEMIAWLASNEVARAAVQSKKNQQDGRVARLAWRSTYRIMRLHRQQGITTS